MTQVQYKIVSIEGRDSSTLRRSPRGQQKRLASALAPSPDERKPKSRKDEIAAKMKALGAQDAVSEKKEDTLAKNLTIFIESSLGLVGQLVSDLGAAEQRYAELYEDASSVQERANVAEAFELEAGELRSQLSSLTESHESQMKAMLALQTKLNDKASDAKVSDTEKEDAKRVVDGQIKGAKIQLKRNHKLSVGQIDTRISALSNSMLQGRDTKQLIFEASALLQDKSLTSSDSKMLGTLMTLLESHSRFQELDAEHRELQSTLDARNSEMIRNRERTQELSSSIKSLKEELTALSKAKQTGSKAFKDKKALYTIAAKEKKTLDSKYAEDSATLESLRGEIESKNKEIDSLKSQLSDQTSDPLDEEQVKLQIDLAIQKGAAAKLGASNRSSAVYLQHTARIKELEKSIQAYEEKVKILTQKEALISQQGTELEELDKKAKLAQSQLDKESIKTSDLSILLQSTQATALALEEENTRLKDEAAKVREAEIRKISQSATESGSVEDFKTAIRELSERIAMVERENTDLGNQLTDERSTSGLLSKYVEQLEAKRKEDAAEIAQLKRDLLSKKVVGAQSALGGTNTLSRHAPPAKINPVAGGTAAGYGEALAALQASANAVLASVPIGNR